MPKGSANGDNGNTQLLAPDQAFYGSNQPAGGESEAMRPAAKYPAAAVARPLSLSTKVFYGVGDVPITVLMVLFGLFTLFFYNSVMGLPASLVGIAIAGSLILDAVMDPYIGYISDRTRGRLGRRHALMLPAALAVGPCFFLLFSPPRDMGQGGLFLWLLVCCIAVRTTSAIYRIPYLSLGAEMSQDYDDRTSTMAVRTIFGLLGTLAAAGLSFLLFFPAMADGSDPKLNYASYPRLGLAFGALMSATGLIGSFGTLSHRSTATHSTVRSARDFFNGFRTSMQNRAFRSIWLSVTLFFMAVVLNASLAIHYFTWYARIQGSSRLSAIQVCFYVGALAGVFFWMSLAKRTEKRTLYIIAGLACATLLCGAALLIGNGHLFGIGNPLPLLMGHVVGGVFASAVWVVPASMVADVTDSDELSTGLRREGIYFGILNLGEKIAAGGALLLAGVLLSLFGHSPHDATQAPAIAPYLGLLYGIVPAILLLIALAFILPYRLDRRIVHEIQRKLALRGESESHACQR